MLRSLWVTLLAWALPNPEIFRFWILLVLGLIRSGDQTSTLVWSIPSLGTVWYYWRRLLGNKWNWVVFGFPFWGVFSIAGRLLVLGKCV
jgi:hypothetical protein